MDMTRILLVDDELDFITPLAKRLRRRGLDVQIATSGPEALVMLDEIPADMVLLDIKMEGMDGVKTLSEIKRRHPQVEVVMLTAHASPDIVISSLAMGACGYLMKPADLNELLLKIEETAQKRKGTPAHERRGTE